jgi:translation elongation factor EF-G
MERVSCDIADEGLLVRGLTEIDVESAVHRLCQEFPDARCSKPRVEYRAGPPLTEPYYRVIVDTPEECWGTVMGDMSTRRGMIQGISDVPEGKRFTAEVPVSEFFGYDTVLRSLTKGRGRIFIEFSHYGSVGDDSAV